MGEARRKSRHRAEILAGEVRCIYCAAAPTQVEHMPPMAMFRARSRLSGLEFASCARCNNGTRASDLVASFFARLGAFASTDDWQIQEAADRRAKIRQMAPGLLEELFREDKLARKWMRGPSGLFRDFVQVDADGPLLKAYLTVFTAKMGMALYREHVGAPLALAGGVHTQWFLNSGLARTTADGLLRMMPMHETLRQGRSHANQQFAYRFNCDDKTILAALVGFHSNLHLFVIATSEPERYGLPFGAPHSDFVRPGELAGRMPAARRQGE